MTLGRVSEVLTMDDALVGAVAHDLTADPFPVIGMDHIRFAVGNARQAAHYYSAAFGMTCVAYRGPEQGHRELAEYVLVSGSGPVRVHRRGPARGRPSVAACPSTATAWSTWPWRCPTWTMPYAYARGARARPVLDEPHDVTDEHGTVRMAAIATYGETRHTLVDRSRYTGPFLPGFVAARAGLPRQAAGSSEALLPGGRPLRRQRGVGRHGHLGRLLQPGDGLHEPGGVRR